MKQIDLPYGNSSLALQLDERYLAGVLYSGLHGYQPSADEATLIEQALAEPTGS